LIAFAWAMLAEAMIAAIMLRAYPQIKDWLFFPSRRAFLRRQMTI
jgi:hypothetical protein